MTSDCVVAAAMLSIVVALFAFTAGYGYYEIKQEWESEAAEEYRRAQLEKDRVREMECEIRQLRQRLREVEESEYAERFRRKEPPSVHDWN